MIREISACRSSNTATTTNALAMGAAAGSNCRNGDLMIATVFSNGAVTLSAPAGWTAIGSQFQSNSRTLMSWYRIASSEPGTNYSFTATGSSTRFGGILVYRSTQGSNLAIDNVATDNGNSATSPQSWNAPTLASGGEFIHLAGQVFGGATGPFAESNGPIWAEDITSGNLWHGYFGVSGTTAPTMPTAQCTSGTGNWMLRAVSIKEATGGSAVFIGSFQQAHNSGTASETPSRSLLESIGDVMLVDVAQHGTATITPPPDITLRVGSTTQNLSTSSLAFTIPNTVLAGDLMTLFVAHGGSTTIASLPMSNGNAFTFVGRSSSGGNPIDVYTRTAVSGDVTGSVTVTANLSGSSYLRIGFAAWYALSGASVTADQFAGLGASGNNNDPTAAVTTTANHEIIIFCVNQATTSGTPAEPQNGLVQAFAVQTFTASWISQPALGLSVNPTWAYGSNSGNESATLSLKSATPVPAWNLIQETTDPTLTMKHSQWWRKVISGEPTSYQFWYSSNPTFSFSNITSFGNCNSTSPVEVALCASRAYPGAYDSNSASVGFKAPRVNPTANDECLYFTWSLQGAGRSISAQSSLASQIYSSAQSAWDVPFAAGYAGIDTCDADVVGGSINTGGQPFAGIANTVVLKAANTPSRPTASLRVSQFSGVIMSSAALSAFTPYAFQPRSPVQFDDVDSSPVFIPRLPFAARAPSFIAVPRSLVGILDATDDSIYSDYHYRIYRRASLIITQQPFISIPGPRVNLDVEDDSEYSFHRPNFNVAPLQFVAIPRALLARYGDDENEFTLPPRNPFTPQTQPGYIFVPRPIAIYEITEEDYRHYQPSPRGLLPFNPPKFAFKPRSVIQYEVPEFELPPRHSRVISLQSTLADRISRLDAEILGIGDSDVRVTRLDAEVLGVGDSHAVNTRLDAEILALGVPHDRITRLDAEILSIGTPHLRITRLDAEILIPLPTLVLVYPSWPDALPRALEYSATESPPDLAIRSTVGKRGGITQARFLTYNKFSPISGTMFFTIAQKATFESFYRDDIAQGSLSFLADLDNTGIIKLYKFIKPPTYQALGDHYIIEMQLAIVAQG